MPPQNSQVSNFYANKININLLVHIFLPFFCRVDIGDRLKATLFYMFQFLVGYFLMLVAMTYSVWLFLAVVLGCGVGYYLANPLMEYSFSQQKEKRSQIDSYVTF